MLISLNRKSWFTLYLSVLRPCIAMASPKSQISCSTSCSNATGPTAQTQTQSTSMAQGTGSIYADLYSIAYVTVPNMQTGKKLAYGLVENQLVACVNLIPQVISIYQWEGKINEDTEALLMLKTKSERVDDVTAYVKANHPYKVCEVISVPIQNGNPEYLRWIEESVEDCPCKSGAN